MMGITIVTAVLSAILGALLGFLLKGRADAKLVHQAKIQAEVERAKNQVREEFWRKLHVEQNLCIRKTGVIRKRTALITTERLYFDQLPITGWVEHESVVGEELASEELNKLAKAASLLVGSDSVRVIQNVLSVAGMTKTAAAKAGV